MQYPPFPRYLIPPRSKYSPQHHILKHPQLRFLSRQRSSLVSAQVSHPYKTTGKIIVLYILIFKFLDSYLACENGTVVKHIVITLSDKYRLPLTVSSLNIST